MSDLGRITIKEKESALDSYLEENKEDNKRKDVAWTSKVKKVKVSEFDPLTDQSAQSNMLVHQKKRKTGEQTTTTKRI